MKFEQNQVKNLGLGVILILFAIQDLGFVTDTFIWLAWIMLVMEAIVILGNLIPKSKQI